MLISQVTLMVLRSMTQAILQKMSLSLQNSSNRFIQWLSDKQLTRNTEKCHLITSTNEHVDIQLGSSRIRGRDGEKLLAVKIDYKLNFDEDVKTYCKKANFRLIIIKTNSIHACWKKENTGDIFFQDNSTNVHLHRCCTSHCNNTIMKNIH